MPPPLQITTPEKSSLLNSGWFTSALYSVFTAGSMLNLYFDSSLMKPPMSRGLGIRMFIAPMRMPHMAQAVSAKMWYSGSAQTMVSGSLAGRVFRRGWAHASFCSRLPTMLRWVSVAPLDTPVVPPVYCRKATSDAFSSTGVSFMPAPCDSASLKRTALGSEKAGTIFFTLRTTKLTITPFSPPSISPMLATTMCLTLVRGSTCSRVVAKFSRMRMASAPESFSWCSSSRGVYRGLTLTTV